MTCFMPDCYYSCLFAWYILASSIVKAVLKWSCRIEVKVEACIMVKPSCPWPRITQFYTDIQTGPLYSHTGYDVTHYLRSEVVAKNVWNCRLRWLDMHADLINSQTGYDLACYFRSGFIEVWKMAQNAATLSRILVARRVVLPNQLGGFLLKTMPSKSIAVVYNLFL